MITKAVKVNVWTMTFSAGIFTSSVSFPLIFGLVFANNDLITRITFSFLLAGSLGLSVGYIAFVLFYNLFDALERILYEALHPTSQRSN